MKPKAAASVTEGEDTGGHLSLSNFMVRFHSGKYYNCFLRRTKKFWNKETGGTLLKTTLLHVISSLPATRHVVDAFRHRGESCRKPTVSYFSSGGLKMLLGGRMRYFDPE